jgi:hypothetical protein
MGPQRFHQHHVSIGRGDKIRTCDPLHPMQVRYQAAPRPDRGTHDSANDREALDQLAPQGA